MAIREHLQQMLHELEEQVPELQREFPDPADFWPAFAPLADAVRSAGGPENDEWIWERIDSMLRHYGLAPRALPA